MEATAVDSGEVSTLDINSFFKLDGQSDRTVFYKSNPGNAGDALIALGAYQLFENANANVRTLRYIDEVDLSGQIVYYAGGGAINPHYGHARKFIERWHDKVERLIILPHTVFDCDALVRSFGDNVDFILREKRSFAYVNDHATNCRVHLADDLALNINVDSLLASGLPLGWQLYFPKQIIKINQPQRKLAIVRLLKLLKNMRFVGLSGVKINLQSPILNAFRMDVEKTTAPIPEDNVDLSKLFEYGTENPTIVNYSSYLFFRFLEHFDTIRTNRLHVAIAAALLGKGVEMFPNSYFKNEAVYNYSLQHRFPNIQWMG